MCVVLNYKPSPFLTNKKKERAEISINYSDRFDIVFLKLVFPKV